MVPLAIHERNGIVAAFILVVGQQVRAFVVQGQVQRDGGRTVNVRIDPDGDAVVRSPVFGGEVARGDKILPVAAAVDTPDVVRRCDLRSEVRPSFTWSVESVMEPTPVNDQCARSSMPSSRREFRTFFCRRRYAAPSCITGCMGIAGVACCANAGPWRMATSTATLATSRNAPAEGKVGPFI